jgi:hypothetical protein
LWIKGRSTEGKKARPFWFSPEWLQKIPHFLAGFVKVLYLGETFCYNPQRFLGSIIGEPRLAPMGIKIESGKEG